MATKERPVIFSGPMVRAILDGRKTQTRRAVKPRGSLIPSTLELDPDGPGILAVSSVSGCLAQVLCPYGQPGDLLYVRETWAASQLGHEHENPGSVVYRADREPAIRESVR